MSVKFIQDDERVDYTPGTDLAAGAVVVVGELVGVTHHPIKANTAGSLAVEGIFDFPKAAGNGSAIAAGAKVYWDAGNSVANAVTTNTYLGKTTLAAIDAAVTVRVRLQQ